MERELAIVQPKIVVCVGVPAAHALIDKKLKIGEEHGHFRAGPAGADLIAVFHPAYVLRLRGVDPEAYARTWRALLDDLRKVAAALKDTA